MCQLANISRASFYRNWELRAPSEAEMELRDAIQKASLANRFYGYRRIAQVVRRDGLDVGVKRVRRIMRDDNLLALRRKKFVVTTDSEHRFTVHPNLAEHLVLDAVNQLWVADITYLRLGAEFVYMAAVLDAFSRKVVGWALGRSLQTSLPLLALERAIVSRQPEPGLVHHSDRGRQYASDDYVELLEEHKMVPSMSRAARPWENGRCESFMNTLKKEEVNTRSYQTLEELEHNIEEFIGRVYNRVRLHSALGYLSPEEFEQQNRPGLRPELSALPAALSFPRHKEIYPDVQKH